MKFCIVDLFIFEYKILKINDILYSNVIIGTDTDKPIITFGKLLAKSIKLRKQIQNYIEMLEVINKKH
jgi:hypothetical protein